MSGYLAHVETGVGLPHGVYAKPPVVGVLKLDGDTVVARVRVAGYRQKLRRVSVPP